MSIPGIGYNKIKARRGKNGNRCNGSSPDGIGLLGADKEEILFKRRSGRIKKYVYKSGCV